jgi:hypothetical protein
MKIFHNKSLSVCIGFIICMLLYIVLAVLLKWPKTMSMTEMTTFRCERDHYYDDLVMVDTSKTEFDAKINENFNKIVSTSDGDQMYIQELKKITNVIDRRLVTEDINTDLLLKIAKHKYEWNFLNKPLHRMLSYNTAIEIGTKEFGGILYKYGEPFWWWTPFKCLGVLLMLALFIYITFFNSQSFNETYNLTLSVGFLKIVFLVVAITITFYVVTHVLRGTSVNKEQRVHFIYVTQYIRNVFRWTVYDPFEYIFLVFVRTNILCGIQSKINKKFSYSLDVSCLLTMICVILTLFVFGLVWDRIKYIVRDVKCIPEVLTLGTWSFRESLENSVYFHVTPVVVSILIAYLTSRVSTPTREDFDKFEQATVAYCVVISVIWYIVFICINMKLDTPIISQFVFKCQEICIIVSCIIPLVFIAMAHVKKSTVKTPGVVCLNDKQKPTTFLLKNVVDRAATYIDSKIIKTIAT